MEQFLGLILALLAFAFIIVLISKAVRWIILVGTIFIAASVLALLEVIG